MRPFSPFVLTALLTASSPAFGYPVFGPATNTCEKWNEEKTRPEGKLGHTAYIAGFLTALNMESRSDQTGSLNVSQVLAEVDQMCVKNPREKVALILQMVATSMHSKAILNGRLPNYEFSF